MNFSQLNLTTSSTNSSQSPNNGVIQQGVVSSTTTTPNGGNNMSSSGSLLFSSTTGAAPQPRNGSLVGGGGPIVIESSNGGAVISPDMPTRCLRCSNQVYALERIGPIKGNIYHKTCFKCLVCERQLDLKTYYTNQIDLNDRQIYCQSHAPKSGKGVFGADSIYIHNVLNAPKLDVMQKVDNKPKVNKNNLRFYLN